MGMRVPSVIRRPLIRRMDSGGELALVGEPTSDRLTLPATDLPSCVKFPAVIQSPAKYCFGSGNPKHCRQADPTVSGPSG
jgi:hypothetical protein